MTQGAQTTPLSGAPCPTPASFPLSLWSHHTRAGIRYHHANVDRLFESWLQSSGALYGHGEYHSLLPFRLSHHLPFYPSFRPHPRKGRTVVKIDKAGSTYVAKGYPATIMKLYDDGCRSAYPNLSARLTYDASRGMRITFNQTQTESDFVVSEFVMKCGTDQYGKIGKLALGSANSMRLIIGWNESSNWAGTIPPLSETYVDPLVFRSTHCLHGQRHCR